MEHLGPPPPIGGIFIKFDSSIFRKSVEKVQGSFRYDKNNGYFTRIPIRIFDQTRSVIFRMRNVSDKSCRENPNFSENGAVYEIMWKNGVEPERPQVTTFRMRIACWVPKATNTHSVYGILFHCNNDYTNAHQCYVIRTLPLLSVLSEYLPREIVENHEYKKKR